MVINELKLKNFRNYSNLHIKLNPHINIFYGNNAQGKTNLLESIYVLGLTKSHLLNIDSSLIKDNESICKIQGVVIENKIKKKLEITTKQDSKILKIDNKEIKKVSDYINNSLNIIIFYPEDLEIIKGSPNNRRNYLNLELSQLSDNYLKILTEYNKLLKIRNDYLKKMNKGEYIDETYFQIITNYLIDKAVLIYKMRNKFVTKINESCGKIFKEITKIDGFNIKYVLNFMIEDDYKTSLYNKLKNNYRKEIKLGTTLYGPHRDELEFYLNNQNMKQYGSQGQKRLAVLSIKLSEIDIFKQYKNTNPIILLDDVFSELDDIKKNNIIKYIGNDIQVIITTTELKKINKFNSASIYKIKDGNVVKFKEVN
jgi:DNA replication and repair protein RecF